METVPKYVPAAKLLGFTLTLTELLVKGATDPDPGDTDNQLPPEPVVALAVKVSATPPLLAITADCVVAVVEPWDNEKLRDEGFTATAGPAFPVTFSDTEAG